MLNTQRNVDKKCFRNRPLFKDSPVKDSENVFDQKIAERLQREEEETLKGLRELKARRRFNEKGGVNYRDRKKEHEKKTISREISTKQVETPSSYPFTKWTKLKILRSRKEKEQKEACFNEEKKLKFYNSLIKLKTHFLREEWNQTCHPNERAIIRENIRLKNIRRIRWKYKINEIVPSTSFIFDKILRYERERKKKLKLRKERTIKIINKITGEMRNGIRSFTKPKKYLEKTVIEEISQESSERKEGEEGRETVSNTEVQEPKIVESKIEESKQEFSQEKEIEIENDVKPVPKIDSTNDDNYIVKPIVIKKPDVPSLEIFPEDSNFFANPSTVTFDDFRVDKKYSKKVTITNKSTKWCYIRFNKLHADVWEPGVIEIEIMDAARINPGLSVAFTVKFSPVHENTVAAEVSFLTSSADHPETFHEFRVPVRCIPVTPVPVVEPRELRFPTAPIWKFADPKLSQKHLTVSNEGEKSFSLLLEERDEKTNYFLWTIDEAEAECVKSSASFANESESDDNDGNKWNRDTPRKTYQIEVPPGVKCRLRIAFKPRHVGLHHEVMRLGFSCDGKIFSKQNIAIWTEVTGLEIHVDPACIDLGILIVDTDVCQQTFKIINSGRNSVEVSTKVAKRLANQVTVHPRSTIVQPEAFSTITVRLAPQSSILDASNRFYDPVSSMLEFPIHVQMVTQDAPKPPPLILKILASLTTPHGLVLEPAHINLGLVHTHESVYAALSLTNESLAIQEYGFLHLPPFMEIQPNYGFGSILPGETVKLHLIYSPCVRDIPGNDIGANGLSSETSFQIEVSSLTEIASNKKPITIDRLKNSYNMQSIIPRNQGIPPPKFVDQKITKATMNVEEQTDKDNLNDNTEVRSFVEEEDNEKTVDVSVEKFTRPDQREKKTIVVIVAHIVDTFCELSEQIIEFPATPCGSFSLATIYLRGFNMASYPHCTCGIVENQDKEFTARYEFMCSSSRVKVLPQRGLLQSNDIVKIDLILEPRLSTALIHEKTRELKACAEEQSDEDEDDKAQKKKKKAKRKVDKEAENSEETFTEADKLAGEINLMETFEPKISTIFVTCELDFETKNERSNEMLFAKLICPITTPDIVILSEVREIAFGPTAIGLPSRKFVLVKNISNRSVKVDTTIMDPFGPFFVSSGKTIETGSILKIPITYQPTREDQEDIQEYFEVFSSRTRTRWRMKVTGRGVAPSYILTPEVRVARFKVDKGERVELKMSIENTGPCPLIFQLRIVDLLEGNVPRVKEEPGEKPKKRRASEEGSGKKLLSKTEFSDSLEAHEELAIYGGNLKRSTDVGYFSFWNLDENMQLLVDEREKMDFAVRFQQPPKEDTSDKKEADKKRKSSKGSRSEEDAKTSNYCHVAMLELYLGNSTFVQSLVVICATN